MLAPASSLTIPLLACLSEVDKRCAVGLSTLADRFSIGICDDKVTKTNEKSDALLTMKDASTFFGTVVSHEDLWRAESSFINTPKCVDFA